MSHREWAMDADLYEDWGNNDAPDSACTCNCMDCIEGIHCGAGYPNPDGTPTLCLYPPPDEDDWDEDDEEEAYWAHHDKCVEAGETPPRHYITVTE